MEYLKTLLVLLYQVLRHLGEDDRWRALIDHVGTGRLYILLFLIIFVETGVVVMPFLPGDSLLFAVGALGARDIGINLPLVTILMILAAVLGDAVNYSIGYRLGPAVFRREDSWLLNKKHLLKAQHFYEKHGCKTIILARFIPIIRTFAPFVAGIGKMSYARFAAYNVVGAVAWVIICVAAGRLFGGMPFVRKNFEIVILAIIFISVLPVVIEVIKHRREAKAAIPTATNSPS